MSNNYMVDRRGHSPLPNRRSRSPMKLSLSDRFSKLVRSKSPERKFIDHRFSKSVRSKSPERIFIDHRSRPRRQSPSPLAKYSSRSPPRRYSDYHPPSSVRRERRKDCPISSCASQERNMSMFRKHCCNKHFPLRFRLEAWEDTALHGSRVEGMYWLSHNILGIANLDMLLDWTVCNIRMPEGMVICEKELEHLSAISRLERWNLPATISAYPPNCIAVLFNWRVLITILASLPPLCRQEFYELDNVKSENGREVDSKVGLKTHSPVTSARKTDSKIILPRPISDNGNQDIWSTQCHVSPKHEFSENKFHLPTESKLQAIDCHFHLDQAKNFIPKLQAWSTVKDFIEVDVGLRPKQSVEVCGGVNVFSDPASYPQVLPHSDGFRSAIGINPSKIENFNEAAFDHLQNLFWDRNCAALGEIGLDHTAPQKTWARQEAVLKELMLWCPAQRPVVFHVRDRDPHAGMLSMKLLSLVKKNMSPEQAIHLHCFSGTTEQVILWQEAFHNCYFGCAGIVKFYDQFQKDAIRMIPEDRLLLETNAPSRNNESFMNTPAFIGDVAEIVASIRGVDMRTILEATTRNARALYCL